MDLAIFLLSERNGGFIALKVNQLQVYNRS